MEGAIFSFSSGKEDGKLVDIPEELRIDFPHMNSRTEFDELRILVFKPTDVITINCQNCTQ